MDLSLALAKHIQVRGQWKQADRIWVLLGTLFPLVKSLYRLTPKIWTYRNSTYFRVYSRELFSFKHNEIGLPIGRKRDMCFPRCIVREGVTSLSCLVSGLYDTDGSVKLRHDKSGDYPRISIAQKSLHIIVDLKRMLSKSFGISGTMYRNEYYDSRVSKKVVRWFLDINGFRNFDLFVCTIGTRHPRVLEKIRKITSMR